MFYEADLSFANLTQPSPIIKANEKGDADADKKIPSQPDKQSNEIAASPTPQRIGTPKRRSTFDLGKKAKKILFKEKYFFLIIDLPLKRHLRSTTKFRSRKR